MCWLAPFPGAAWFSADDQTGGEVICKPIDQVAELGKISYALVRFWRILRDLPLPPIP